MRRHVPASAVLYDPLCSRQQVEARIDRRLRRSWAVRVGAVILSGAAAAEGAVAYANGDGLSEKIGGVAAIVVLAATHRRRSVARCADDVLDYAVVRAVASGRRSAQVPEDILIPYRMPPSGRFIQASTSAVAYGSLLAASWRAEAPLHAVALTTGAAVMMASVAAAEVVERVEFKAFGQLYSGELDKIDALFDDPTHTRAETGQI